MSRVALVLIVLFAVTAQAASLADPTRPPHAVPASPDKAASANSPLAVSSIVYSPGRRVATIGGRLVREGDQVGSATVVRIERAAVELSGPEGRFTLRLTGDSVKKRQEQGR